MTAQTPEHIKGEVRLDFADKPLMVFKAAEIVESGGYEGDPRIRGVGCSSQADTDGDRWLPSALQDLKDYSLGLNVILNHVPMVPGNLFGSVMDAQLGKRVGKNFQTGSEEMYDVVEIESDVWLGNPNAVQTYEAIAGIGTRPKKLGYSVGAIYTAAKRRTEKAFGRTGVDVEHAYPGEYSVHNMPSNRLSWIELVKKQMKTHGYLPQDAEKGWNDDEVQYVLAHRDDFVASDTDEKGLMVWTNLEQIARALEPFGVVPCIRR